MHICTDIFVFMLKVSGNKPIFARQNEKTAMAEAKKERDLVCCLDCANATFMQWMQNPIVAHCTSSDERQVAESRRLCKNFKARNTEPQITHYDHYDD